MNNNEVLLSICIPTYNRAKALDGNLKALNKQVSGKNLPLELMVSDNCSSDETSTVVNKYIEEGMPINYIRNTINLGMDGNFAQCYRKASGKYVLVLGDDDYLIDGMLEKLLDYLKNGDYGLVHLKTNSQAKILEEEFTDSTLFLQNVSYWVTYISSNVVNAKYIKGYDFEKNFGTFLTIVPLYLNAAASHDKNLLIHELVFNEGIESNSNGGYNFFEVFVVNYLKIWKDFVNSKTIPSKLFYLIKRDIFKYFLATYIVELLILKKTGNFKVKSAKKILFFSYGHCLYAYYYLIKLITKQVLRKIYVSTVKIKSNIYSYYASRNILKMGKKASIKFPFYVEGSKSIIIGDNFTCYKRTRIEAVGKIVIDNPKIIIGDNVCINWDCHIGALELIKIDSNVLIGSRVLITDHSHGNNEMADLMLPPSKRVLYSKGPVIIEENVWIGDGAAVLPNVTIGKNSIIGANTVITKDVPPNCIVVGNPARIVKTFSI
ncbi:acetyltransferase-like isoleucine patch superfamily enzyme [Flavobacterium limicola]|uniref:Acetyltransferase-like isoleucine patch superfamily enzyme n=1 Tax=Flavobacterium limicola TaxID=180441 RepID=A0A495RR45_9FLAO|nr:glycosyltransferase [Flavobacterium limicola]RKS89749.1 acetyltransferase-like isoleucine patch superfamily enzyme [Flavobacterium limicola]